MMCRFILPSGMENYIAVNGWHFNKRLCEFAVSRMRRMNPESGEEEPLKFISKEQAENFLEQYGVKIKNAEGYDCVYVLMMGKADVYKDSVPDDAHLAKYVKNYLDDVDGYEGIALTRYFVDCLAKGVPIIWEDMI